MPPISHVVIGEFVEPQWGSQMFMSMSSIHVTELSGVMGLVLVDGLLLVWLGLLTAWVCGMKRRMGQPVWRRLRNGRIRFQWGVPQTLQSSHFWSAAASNVVRDHGGDSDVRGTRSRNAGRHATRNQRGWVTLDIADRTTSPTLQRDTETDPRSP